MRRTKLIEAASKSTRHIVKRGKARQTTVVVMGRPGTVRAAITFWDDGDITGADSTKRIRTIKEAARILGLEAS